MIRRHLAKALLPVVIVLFSTGVSPTWALTLTGVGIEPRAFDPTANQTSQVRFKLDQKAAVKLHIYDPYERLIRSVESVGQLDPGEHYLDWDGYDQAGRQVVPEAYHYTLESRAKDGSTVTHDLTDLTGGEPLEVNHVEWDAKTKRVHYTLTRSARINLRAGISNYGPLLKTLLDWVPRQAGRHSLEWNGWDSSRVLNLTSHPKLEIRANAFTLPRNTVFILPSPDQTKEPVELPWKAKRRTPSHASQTQARDYARQSAEERRDIALTLNLVNRYQRDKEGVALVTGQVPIRMDVAEARYAALFKQRFEPVFFVDGVFLGEVEVGFLPTTYVWDSSGFNPGLHYLTVNIVGYEGSMGSATIKLRVED